LDPEGSRATFRHAHDPRPPAMDLSDLRKNYLQGGLRRQDLDPDPCGQFTKWFNQAMEADLVEPNAMTLGTVDDRNRPSQRTVLLKFFDARGFVFFTNFESRKAAHIAGNPEVSLLFPWLALERQIIIQGRAEKIPTTESLRYFLSRPRESQLGAWVSRQSSVISSRSLLEQKLAEIKRKFANGEVPLPSFWGGYRVIPTEMEFWQGGAGRLHDRFLYRRESPTEPWTIERLSP
jgi:pyridoxamine 5'-phosphate oxidase